MRIRYSAILFLACFVLRSTLVDGQPSDPALAAKEVQKWVEEYKDWREWYAVWGNRPASPRRLHWEPRRKTKPDPPAWLSDYCLELEVPIGIYQEACELLDEWRIGLQTILVRQKKQTAVAQQEKVSNSSWLNRVHLDAGYTSLNPGQKLFGTLGMHMTLPEIGRVQIYIPPGIILLLLPDASGNMRLVPATTWGFSIRMFQFGLPGSTRRATAHFNLAKAWVPGQFERHVGVNQGGLDVGGLSITLNKKP